MKTKLAIALLLTAATASACDEERKKNRGEDDDSSAEGGGGGSQGGAGGAGGTTEHPDGPKFLSFSTSVPAVHESESVTFTAVVTDPQGAGDIVGGSLEDDSGAPYGTFTTNGQGSFQLLVNWSAINEVAAIDFAYGVAYSRTFVAEFSDNDGHVSTREIQLELSCNGLAACGGACTDTEHDFDNCGACNAGCGDDLCVADSFCESGSCVGDTVDCSFLDDACTTGECNPSTGQCVADDLPNNTSCDDGDVCTANDVCTGGVCDGTDVTGGTIFSEDFSDNLAVWTLGNEWGIGAATASSGQSTGGPDPANDHTATVDDGVAGVLIGGNYSIALHAYYYLTSPVINTNVAGNVTLTFYRWLNSDTASYVNNVVEVWNGASWVSVYSGIATDAAWTLQTIDLTPYKNAALRVRFGHSVISSSAYAASGWNIDDFLVSGAGGGC